MSQILDPVDELESKKVAELARTVVRTRTDVTKTVAAMIASRQLYAMAIHELQRQIELLPFELKHELLAECLIQSAANQAGMQFDESTLLNGFTDTVFPWMKKTCEIHTKLDETAKKQQLAEYELARRAVNIPLPFSVGLTETNELERTQTLVLVGWKPVVNFVLNMVEEFALEKQSPALCLVRLNDDSGNSMDLVHSPKHFTMGADSWSASCAGSKSFGQFFVSRIAPNLSCAPDLVICDNLKKTVVSEDNRSLQFQRNAAVGHKRLRAFAHTIGCGFVGGVPLDENIIPDLNQVYWDELKHWSCFRAVWVKENSENSYRYDVYLGNKTYLTTVDKEEIESGK